MPRLVSPHVQHNVPHPHADLRQQRVQSLLETFLRGTRKLLREGSNRSRARKSARTLLEERGVSLDDLKGLAVGLLIDPEEMAQRLAESGFRPEEIEASKLTADPRAAMVDTARGVYPGCRFDLAANVDELSARIDAAEGAHRTRVATPDELPRVESPDTLGARRMLQEWAASVGTDA